MNSWISSSRFINPGLSLLICFLTLPSCDTSPNHQKEATSSRNNRQIKTDSLESLRYVNQGKSLILQHEYLDAYAAFTTAIEISEKNASAYRYRAWLDHEFLHPETKTAGQADWAKARKLEPEHPPNLLEDWLPE